MILNQETQAARASSPQVILGESTCRLSCTFPATGVYKLPRSRQPLPQHPQKVDPDPWIFCKKNVQKKTPFVTNSVGGEGKDRPFLKRGTMVMQNLRPPNLADSAI